MPKSVFAVLLLLIYPAGNVAAAAQPSRASAGVPRFEKAPCPIEVAADERIDCGVLVVPENRRAAHSRSVRLPVMIFRSRAAQPAPDPLLFMPGGPGNSSVAGRRSGKGLPFLDDRDYILVEQRGARHAVPALECPETNRLAGEIAAGRLRGSAAQDELLAAAAACRRTLAASGVDLDGYTSEATADDVEDLRQVLGYETWNLYGLSYGTRVMLTVLRKYPAGVRSVILDSVLPPEVNFDEVAAFNLQRSLNAVFDGCAIDHECGAAFPNLRQRFLDLVAAADRSPLPLQLSPSDTGGRPAEIRGAQVVDAVYSALHDVEAIPSIPRLIGEAAAGRWDELTHWVRGNQGPSRSSWGLRYSVWCAEEMPFEDAARVAAQISPALGLGGVDERTTTPEVCRVWNVAAAANLANQPVESDVPTLVFAGEFDPDTPPDWGRRLLASMRHAVYVEMRGRSHGAGFSACGGKIATAFLRDPSAPPPVACALTLRGADFGAGSRPRAAPKP